VIANEKRCCALQPTRSEALYHIAASTAPKQTVPEQPKEASSPPNFDEYLRQLKAWPEFIRTEQIASRRASGALMLHSSHPRGLAEKVQPGPILTELQETVPELFFAADFDIQDSETFKDACPLHVKDETSVTHKLTGYLDTVRVQSTPPPPFCSFHTESALHVHDSLNSFFLSLFPALLSAVYA
jgi:hypothetical protein